MTLADRKDVTDGNHNGTDGRTDRQTDRRTDRVLRNMRPPPREEGRIISYKLLVLCSRFSISNYQINSMISLYPIVTYIIIILDRLLTFIYPFLVLKVDS